MECLENTCQDPIKDAGLGVKAMKRGWRQQPLLLHLASARRGQRGRSPGAGDARGDAEPPHTQPARGFPAAPGEHSTAWQIHLSLLSETYKQFTLFAQCC